MSDIPFVAFNVLTVPEQARATLEERFANRAGEVETMPGFRHFELLRPVEGTDRYLVYTRWDSKADFDSWVSSMEFKRGHAGGDQDGAETTESQPRPAATGSEVWTFEAIQMKDAPKG
jgi:heme oxygenase (mycobilin-producing)